MKMKKNILNLWGFGVALLSLTLGAGCSDDETDSASAGTFEIAEEHLSYDFTQAQEIVFIPVRSNVPEDEWKVESSDASWCKASKSYTNEKGLQLAVLESEEPEVRKATVKVSAAGREYEIAVRQLGYGPAILVSNKTVSDKGGDFDLSITANIDFTVGMPVLEEGDEAGWIQSRGLQGRSFAAKNYGFYCEANTSAFSRKATVAVTAADPMYMTCSTKCTITQETRTVSAEKDVPKDPEVKPTGAADNQHHGSDVAANLLDGDMGTVFHSPWGVEYDNPTTVFPVLLDFTFDGTKNIDYFKLYSGNAGSNGCIGKFDVLYKLQGDTEYQELNDAEHPFDFGQRGGEQTARFPKTLVNVTDIRISVRDGSGDNGAGTNEGFAAAKEIEFYESKAGEINEVLLTVFTDLSCSELKEGITRTEITALYTVSPFVAQVAVKLQENAYDESEKGFRVQTYKPYSDVSINSALLTRHYSPMDNPTGIEVKADETIIVCLDKVPTGQNVEVAVYGDSADGTCPNYSSPTQTAALAAGMNSVKISSPGMLYVLNTARPLTAASEPVKVHILPSCGAVQGYFDLTRDMTDDDYKTLLARTTYKYFVAKGHNIIFNFLTSQLRKDAPDGIISGLEAWDNIVRWELELMGLDNRTDFNNHMMAVTSTDPEVYMNATDYRVMFSADALYKIITREQLLAAEDNAWGPAHEIGHVNQAAINWKSTNESSNNLFSNYVIYKMGKYGSRGDMLSELAASWANEESWVKMGGATHKNEDTEIHMRMNWQLWIYYHLCGKKPDFWPTLFENLRQKPLPTQTGEEKPGERQLEFAVRACEAAQEDLTEFFETWGFFIPVQNIDYDQYGPAKYNVTDKMIADTKAKIAAMSLPKAAPIQYIEDRSEKDGVTYSDMGYYTTFQNGTKITKTPTYMQTNRSFTVSNCDQAVAIEVRKPASGDKLGDLLYFSNRSTFTVPDKVPGNFDLANAVLYAVQYDGERKLINK